MREVSVAAYVAFAIHHAIGGNLQPGWFAIYGAISLWIVVLAAFLWRTDSAAAAPASAASLNRWAPGCNRRGQGNIFPAMRTE
jgi:hypothetical protein